MQSALIAQLGNNDLITFVTQRCVLHKVILQIHTPRPDDEREGCKVLHTNQGVAQGPSACG